MVKKGSTGFQAGVWNARRMGKEQDWRFEFAPNGQGTQLVIRIRAEWA